MAELKPQCKICSKTFATNSSLNRHAARCSPGRLPASRRKSCLRCVSRKLRCDLQRPRCSRCEESDGVCQYAPEQQQHQHQHYAAGLAAASPRYSREPLTPSLSPEESSSTFEDTSGGATPAELLEIGDMDWITDDVMAELPPQTLGRPEGNGGGGGDGVQGLSEMARIGSSSLIPQRSLGEHRSFCPLMSGIEAGGSDMSGLRDRWMLSLTNSGEIIEMRPNRLRVDMYGRILNAYAERLAQKDHYPPFIHPRQLVLTRSPNPLTRCIDLMRMSQVSSSLDMVLELMQNESSRIFADYLTYDETMLTAATQALLIYAIKAFCHVRKPSSYTRGAAPKFPMDSAYLGKLQNVAYHLSRFGMMLPEEQAHSKPDWDRWVLAEARRRTIVALYHFEFQFNVHFGLAIIGCGELNPLIAPQGKSLWQARDRDEWDRFYGRWLVRWEDGGCYRLGELLQNAVEGTTASERLDRYMEEIDELGTFFTMATKFAQLAQLPKPM